MIAKFSSDLAQLQAQSAAEENHNRKVLHTWLKVLVELSLVHDNNDDSPSFCMVS